MSAETAKAALNIVARPKKKPPSAVTVLIDSAQGMSSVLGYSFAPPSCLNMSVAAVRAAQKQGLSVTDSIFDQHKFSAVIDDLEKAVKAGQKNFVIVTKGGLYIYGLAARLVTFLDQNKDVTLDFIMIESKHDAVIKSTQWKIHDILGGPRRVQIEIVPDVYDGDITSLLTQKVVKLARIRTENKPAAAPAAPKPN